MLSPFPGIYSNNNKSSLQNECQSPVCIKSLLFKKFASQPFLRHLRKHNIWFINRRYAVRVCFEVCLPSSAQRRLQQPVYCDNGPLKNPEWFAIITQLETSNARWRATRPPGVAE
jgi:hypothetical protein